MALFFNRKKSTDDEMPAQSQRVQEVPLTDIVPNRFQPRKVFAPEAIADLAATIERHGLLQPIILREYEPHKYEIIAGERRFRALQSLHSATAKAIVQEMTDDESASMALVENLQREGLSAIEEAQAYTDLMKLNGMTQQALAQEMGKSQSFIANKLRLLKLSEPVQQAIMDGSISERHGRELLKLDEYHQQLVLSRILTENLTVKETTAVVNQELGLVADTPKKPTKPRKTPVKSRTKMIATKDTRMAVNTLKESLALIEQSGYQTSMTTEKTETGVAVNIQISAPKPDPTVSATADKDTQARTQKTAQ